MGRKEEGWGGRERDKEAGREIRRKEEGWGGWQDLAPTKLLQLLQLELEEDVDYWVIVLVVLPGEGNVRRESCVKHVQPSAILGQNEDIHPAHREDPNEEPRHVPATWACEQRAHICARSECTCMRRACGVHAACVQCACSVRAMCTRCAWFGEPPGARLATTTTRPTSILLNTRM